MNYNSMNCGRIGHERENTFPFIVEFLGLSSVFLRVNLSTTANQSYVEGVVGVE